MATAPQSSWTILEILKWTTEYFRAKGVEEPRASAEVLLAHALGLNRLDLYLKYDQPLTQEELDRFKALIVRRRAGEPVAYLTGHKEFWSLDFLVNPAVLIPRPETEILVQAVLEKARELVAKEAAEEDQPKTGNRKPETGPWGLEIGVGSGAVAVTLARELPEISWVALDLSFDALMVALQNARRLDAAARLHFLQGDLVAALKPAGRFTFLVANLPYVPRRVWERLPKGIKDFEPKEALLGGEDGLTLIRRLSQQAHLYLRPGGWLALEVAEGQAEAVQRLLAETGRYQGAEMIRDYQGVLRVVRARTS